MKKEYKLYKNGFQIFKNVFSKEEIQLFREKLTTKFIEKKKKINQIEIIKNKFSNTLSSKCDLIDDELEEFDYIVLNKKILKCVKELIGEEIVYFCDNSLIIGNGPCGYHKDNVSRDNIDHSDWQSKYTVIRMGLYFQDSENHSGGLIIRDGSHKFVNLFKGNPIILPLKEGDLVFWLLTTTHSGNAKRLKLFPKIPLMGRIQRSLPEFFFKEFQKNRVAIFCTYANQGVHLENYLNFLNSRNDMKECFKNCHFTEKSILIAKNSKVKLLNPKDL